MSTLRKFIKYSSYVLKHKWYVFQECLGEGMLIRGIVHDWHKFLPSEFFPYLNHFGEGIQRGRDKTGYYKPTDTGDPAFDKAWKKHCSRGTHHWQNWVIADEPKENGEPQVKIFEMPYKDRLEMVCDWRGASLAQGLDGDITNWYRKNGHKMLLGPKTRAWVEKKLKVVREETRKGEKNERPNSNVQVQ